MDALCQVDAEMQLPLSMVAVCLAAYKRAQDMLPSTSEFTVVALAYSILSGARLGHALVRKERSQCVYAHVSATATQLRPI